MACPHGTDVSTCARCASAPELTDTVAPTLRHDSASEVPATATTQPDAPNVSRIGRFVIIAVVGQGGMGVVYSAYDPALNRRVAIKVLRAPPGDSRAQGDTARLAREAQAMAQLSHPNVVPVYDVGRLGDSLFVAMEFVEGATLHHWLKETPRTWREVLNVMVAAGRGLEAAHGAGLIHRDFKPTNVLVGLDGRVRVTDFGLARSVRSEPAREPVGHTTPSSISLDTPLTLGGAVMGTPGYMALEQYARQDTSPATDQFAFCVSLYEALYGARPFEGNDLGTLERATREGAVPSPPKGSSVPAWLFPIIEQGLSSDPNARHRSMRALLDALARDPTATRRRVALAGAAAVVTLGIAAALWAWPRVRVAQCHRETDQHGAAWNDEARRKAEHAFLSSAKPFAAVTWASSRATLDSFTAAWVTERHAACDDTLLRGTHSERQLSLRLRCLETRWVELQTLAARFQAADAEVVAQSVMAAASLTPVARCANLASLEALATRPADTQREVDELEGRLAEGRALVALGKYDDAATRLTSSVVAARRLADAQTLANALFELGRLEREANRYDSAAKALDEALELSISAGDERTALHTLGLLTSLRGWRLSEPAASLALITVGRGLVPRVHDPILEALLDEGEGDTRWKRGDWTGALAAYRRAVTLLQGAQGETALAVAKLEASIGWTLMELSELSEARDFLERSRRSREVLLGADHPLLATNWNDLGQLAELLDDVPTAVAAYRRYRAFRALAQRASKIALGRADLKLARVLTLAGDLDEAAAVFRSAEDELLHAEPDTAASLQRTRARLSLAQLEFGRALAEARSSLVAVEKLDDPLAEAISHTVMGRALWGLHRDDEALAQLDEALRIHESKKETRSNRYVEVLNARAHVLGGDVKGSEPMFVAAEAALTAALALEGNSRLKADGHHLMGKALWARGEKEAARLAMTRALEVATAGGVEGIRTQAQAWLDAHPAP